MTTDTYLRIRRVVLLVLAVPTGAAFGMMLWFVLAALLFPFFWSGGIVIGLWVGVGITALLVLTAAVRFVRGKDRLCYWHAVLGGLVVFMAVLGVGVIGEYGFHTVPRSMPLPAGVGSEEF